MPASFLFRIDGAKDNDAFFNALKSSVSHVYAGVDAGFGSSNWKPDFLKVVIGESNDFTLTLIELDVTESIVRASCRKYLPENSTDIINTFQEYLDQVIRQCHSSADPRKDEFTQLKATLLNAEKIIVTTAGAFRSSIDFLEEFSLIDQPQRVMQMQPVSAASRKKSPEEVRAFRGTLRLSSDEAKALGRPILIFDSIIRHFDHSNATFRVWRGSARSNPLKKLLTKNKTAYPNLYSLIVETVNIGITLDFEKLLSELVAMWADAGDEKIDHEHIRNLISRYSAIASQIKQNSRMRAIFDDAHKFLADKEI